MKFLVEIFRPVFERELVAESLEDAEAKLRAVYPGLFVVTGHREGDWIAVICRTDDPGSVGGGDE
jgi:hypothetical protein